MIKTYVSKICCNFMHRRDFASYESGMHVSGSYIYLKTAEERIEAVNNYRSANSFNITDGCDDF